LPLAACQSTGYGNDYSNKEFGGTLVGAGLGGYLGSQIGSGTGQLAATAVGVLLGGMLGQSLGSSLDTADRAAYGRAEQRAYTAPIGQQVVWNNPNSGNSGVIVPTRDGYTTSGQYCREFQQTITVGGQRQQAFGRACQQPDGSWQIVQ
jgi:surface antigen